MLPDGLKAVRLNHTSVRGKPDTRIKESPRQVIGGFLCGEKPDIRKSENPKRAVGHRLFLRNVAD